MGLVTWISLFLMLTCICAWIVLGNGVETVTGLITAILLGADVNHWSDEGIRLFVGLTWLLLAIWFVVGLVQPALRL